MSNFIPNETMLVNDRDPPWITSKLKNIIQEKNLLYKNYIKPNDHTNFQMIRFIENVIGQF